MCVQRRFHELLALNVCLLTMRAVHSNDIVTEDSSSNKSDLVKAIRRQLMDNNYEYMPSESDEYPLLDDGASSGERVTSPPFVHHDALQEDAHHFDELYQKSKHIGTTTSSLFFGTEMNKNGIDDWQLQTLVQRARDVDVIEHSPEVSKKDLLYYINDDLFRRAESMSHSRESSAGDEHTPTTTTVQYKLFTVKTGGSRGHRRSGGRDGGSKRVFLREQRPGEVVLVRLDDKPFPDFRLPPARRQYMEQPPTGDNAPTDISGY